MTKTNSWICDICKKEFKQLNFAYKTNVGFDITIPGSGKYEQETKYVFQDTCSECRFKLRDLIESLIKD